MVKLEACCHLHTLPFLERSSPCLQGDHSSFSRTDLKCHAFSEVFPIAAPHPESSSGREKGLLITSPLFQEIYFA